MLPYHDNKPKGAADFYFAINATFRFIKNRFGMDQLIRYWIDLGRSAYYQPVAEDWKSRGLKAVAEYWRDFFAAEPDAVVNVTGDESSVRVEVLQCPAIHHLKTHSREVVPEFCQHCYFVSNALASSVGMEARVVGGAGSCVQTFAAQGFLGTQDLNGIRRVE